MRALQNRDDQDRDEDENDPLKDAGLARESERAGVGGVLWVMCGDNIYEDKL